METGHYDPRTCAVLQIAAVRISQRDLKVGETFQSYIKPEPGFIVTPEALAVNGITDEQLATAPPLKQVFADFSMYVNNFNYKKSSWGSPIAVGYNIGGFDLPIIQRVAEQFGEVDKNGKQKLFSNFFMWDLMHDFQRIFENSGEVPNLKLSETILPWLGIKPEGAHNAIEDVKNTAKVFVRMVKLYREWYPRVKMKGAFA